MNHITTQKIITNWKQKTDRLTKREMQLHYVTSFKLSSRINAREFVILFIINSVGDLVDEIRLDKLAFCEVKFQV